MIKYCLDKWNHNKNLLKKALREDITLNNCDYTYLVKLVVRYILNEDDEGDYRTRFWDYEHITEIDNGDYQGTLLWLIPERAYQPAEYDYLMTYCVYGSCSGCDTLQAIQEWGEKPPTERQLEDFMTLCKDLVCNMIKPYNCGWRNEKEFMPVEEVDNGSN